VIGLDCCCDRGDQLPGLGRFPYSRAIAAAIGEIECRERDVA
jgi:hypothetical protein